MPAKRSHGTAERALRRRIRCSLFCRRLLVLVSCRCGVEETRIPRQRCPTQMIPLDVFGSESVAADLLQQFRWRDSVSCPRWRSDRTVRSGGYGHFQWYFCKDCGRTFNDKTGTIFAHSKIALRKWLFSIYAFLRFNTNLRQLQCKIEVIYKTIHRRVERFVEALDAPSLGLRGPVETDEFYVSADLKGRERDQRSRSRPLQTRARNI